jgi:peptide-methionine (S)-S-oxide reductase
LGPGSAESRYNKIEGDVVNSRAAGFGIALIAGLAIAFYFAQRTIVPWPQFVQGATPPMTAAPTPSTKTETATLAGGCFWCTEAVFQQLKGVQSVVSGYTGGLTKNPTYEQVCTGMTGHAEAIQIVYDPTVISFAELLEVFWQTHDPTTRNRQGNDVGTQYRSAIFFHSDEQRKLAEEYKKKLDAAGAFRSPIVTEIERYTEFYTAEKYHQDFFATNPRQSYCLAVIPPKLEKLKKVFADKVKTAPTK